jgi:hypothetical protein
MNVNNLTKNVVCDLGTKIWFYILIAYHALVHSNITYAILVWGHSTHLCKVFNQQRKCIRVLGGLAYRDACRDMFKTLKILTVPVYSVEITYGINSVISKLMTFAENSETGRFLFLIMLILSYFTCS